MGVPGDPALRRFTRTHRSKNTTVFLKPSESGPTGTLRGTSKPFGSLRLRALHPETSPFGMKRGEHVGRVQRYVPGSESDVLPFIPGSFNPSCAPRSTRATRKLGWELNGMLSIGLWKSRSSPRGRHEPYGMLPSPGAPHPRVFPTADEIGSPPRSSPRRRSGSLLPPAPSRLRARGWV